MTAAILSFDPFGSGSEPGRSAAFLVLLGFVVSFLFIRTSARMNRAEISWWPGSVETKSGVHLHHLVWGISAMLVAGFTSFALNTPISPWYQLTAILFGIGAGLTFDEFALWVNLRDVYWAKEGRESLDAVVGVTAFMALVVVGTKPFGLDDEGSITGTGIAIAQALILSVITFFKGRIALGALSVFIPFLGLWGALRLAKPHSPWAHRRYSEEKMALAAKRYPPDSRGERFKHAFFNAIGGKVSEPD